MALRRSDAQHNRRVPGAEVEWNAHVNLEFSGDHPGNRTDIKDLGGDAANGDCNWIEGLWIDAVRDETGDAGGSRLAFAGAVENYDVAALSWV